MTTYFGPARPLRRTSGPPRCRNRRADGGAFRGRNQEDRLQASEQIACLDAAYSHASASAACVTFRAWGAETPVQTLALRQGAAAAYEPGFSTRGSCRFCSPSSRNWRVRPLSLSSMVTSGSMAIISQGSAPGCMRRWLNGSRSLAWPRPALLTHCHGAFPSREAPVGDLCLFPLSASARKRRRGVCRPCTVRIASRPC
jgi:hypothetical protein